jgi:hypothetical protein
VTNRTPAAVSAGNASSFVQGYLRRYLNATGSYDFPVGEATKGYQRANISFAYPGAPTTIDNLRVYFSTYGALPVPLGVTDCGVVFSSNALNNGKWTFTASNSAASGNYDLTLYNTNFTNAANAWTIMSSAGTGWSLANGTCVVSPVNAVRRNNMNNMFDFGTAQGPSALPVELLSFTAVPDQDKVVLKWVTSSETDNRGFEVEKLNPNDNSFSNIGWVDGQGTSVQPVYYSFDDNEVETGQDYFYRLRQIDFNGQESLSEVAHVRLRNDLNSSILVSPNPLTNASVLQIELKEVSEISVVFLNSLGQEVGSLQPGLISTGSYSLPLNEVFKPLEAGIYTIKVFVNDEPHFVKVLKNK